MTTPDRPVAPPATRPSPTRHATQALLRSAVRLARWFWAIALVAIAATVLVIWLVNGSVDQVVAAYALNGAVWFPFSQAIALSGTHLPAHVAAGMTRRTFARAALGVTVVTGVGYAAVLALLVLVERSVHGLLGWGTGMTTVGLPLGQTSTGELAVALLALVPALVLANVTGLLVGLVYLRAGSLWGTLTLPLTVGPLALVLYVLPFVPFFGVQEGAARIALAMAVGALLAVVYAAVVATSVRRTPLASAPA